MADQQPRQACGWCITGHHTLCVRADKSRWPVLSCGCTSQPGTCGGDIR